jgi:hypothetical protein
MKNSADLYWSGNVLIGFGGGEGDCRGELSAMPSRSSFDVSTESVAPCDAAGQRAAAVHLWENDRIAEQAFFLL